MHVPAAAFTGNKNLVSLSLAYPPFFLNNPDVSTFATLGPSARNRTRLHQARMAKKTTPVRYGAAFTRIHGRP